jgi:hypothetical protein
MELILTTYDGKDILDPVQQVFIVDNTDWVVYNRLAENAKSKELVFSTKEAANAYLFRKRPCLCFDDVKEISEYSKQECINFAQFCLNDRIDWLHGGQPQRLAFRSTTQLYELYQQSKNKK